MAEAADLRDVLCGNLVLPPTLFLTNESGTAHVCHSLISRVSPEWLQRLVRLPRLGFDDLQLLDDLRDGPVGFGVAGADVAAGGDVVSFFFSSA